MVTTTLTVPQSVTLAQRTYGTPACGTPTLMWETAPTPDTADAAGWVYESGDCRIHLNYPLLRANGGVCETIVHEWGHLTGRGHSTNPGDWMYPSLRNWAACHPTVVVRRWGR